MTHFEAVRAVTDVTSSQYRQISHN